jgi:hypothetical protein
MIVLPTRMSAAGRLRGLGLTHGPLGAEADLTGLGCNNGSLFHE